VQQSEGRGGKGSQLKLVRLSSGAWQAAATGGDPPGLLALPQTACASWGAPAGHHARSWCWGLEASGVTQCDALAMHMASPAVKMMVRVMSAGKRLAAHHMH
jgi:hypothetical protein